MGLVALKNEDLPHYTYDDYVRWEGRWEIIDGIPYAVYPAPSKKHQRVSLKIAGNWKIFTREKLSLILVTKVAALPLISARFFRYHDPDIKWKIKWLG